MSKSLPFAIKVVLILAKQGFSFLAQLILLPIAIVLYPFIAILAAIVEVIDDAIEKAKRS